ncbi:hypothetical protein BAZMOX_72554_2 [methanotrophic endosymbiont of Bathymodiolus azoricus (Menez Gwen)]|nr:hypothetical protein BAZMOX_72554_2 [methanotrophic endosymbiont of Bathymodiolus azoricus (Menez Gwen)]
MAGDRLAELEFRAKPEIVAIDDIDTYFFFLLLPRKQIRT